MALRMAIYAAQIDRVDQGIGRITAALKRTGQLENTIIFFLADNGGCAEGGIWGFERKKNAVLGKDSSFASYGLSWANASNTPFREYKHWVHEGGISTPLVVHWPAGISSGGELRSHFHRVGVEIGRRENFIEVSPGAPFLGGKTATEEQDLAGAALTDNAGKDCTGAHVATGETDPVE